mgnify:CR=1 FL=1
MKKTLNYGIMFVLAGAAALFAFLYFSHEKEAASQHTYLNKGRLYLLSGQKQLFDITERSFDAIGLFGFREGCNKWVPVGAPKSNYRPVFVPSNIKCAIADDEGVIGVLNGDTATAYPLRVLVEHQIVNDDKQSPPVTVYFGGNSHTAAAFSTPATDKTVILRSEDESPSVVVEAETCDYLACTGFLYKNVDMLYDLASESMFVPVTGMFAAGDRIGERLRILPSAVMTLGQWRKMYPDTRVMIENTGLKSIRYPRRDVMAERLSLKARFAARADSPYKDNESIISISDGWDAVAVVFSDARRAGKHEIACTLGGREYVAHFSEDYNAAWITDNAGKLSPSVRSIYRPVISLWRTGNLTIAR